MKEKTLLWKEKARGFLREKGVYVVVFASLGAIALTAALTMGAEGEVGESTTQAEGMAQQAAPTESEAPQQSPAPAAAVAAQADERLEDRTAFLTPVPTIAPTPTLIPDFSPAPAAELNEARRSEAPARKAVSPVSGPVIWQFARDELIYSSTLDQWMTHLGADIAAALDTPVRAIYGGVVADVFADDAFGVTVVVEHEDGLKSVYANLREAPPVQAGARVEAGDTLGYVGDTALSECEAQSHLHFEIWKNGEAENPEEHCLFLN